MNLPEEKFWGLLLALAVGLIGHSHFYWAAFDLFASDAAYNAYTKFGFMGASLRGWPEWISQAIKLGGIGVFVWVLRGNRFLSVVISTGLIFVFAFFFGPFLGELIGAGIDLAVPIWDEDFGHMRVFKDAVGNTLIIGGFLWAIWKAGNRKHVKEAGSVQS